MSNKKIHNYKTIKSITVDTPDKLFSKSDHVPVMGFVTAEHVYSSPPPPLMIEETRAKYTISLPTLPLLENLWSKWAEGALEDAAVTTPAAPLLLPPDESWKDAAVTTPAAPLPPLVGGNSSLFNKYLKYKQKYMMLKYNKIDIKDTILDNNTDYYSKYKKYKLKYYKLNNY